MRRSTVNFLVDLSALACLLGLAGTGIILRWVLPPGSGGHGPGFRGSGSPAGEAGRQLWGLGRHDWGGVHFWISIVFLMLVLVHLILHWKWITGYLRNRLRGGTRCE